MSLKKVTTEITYKVPAWEYCNMQGNVFGQPTKEKCRFCIKEKDYYRCALYNVVLDTTQGSLVSKTQACYRATAGFNSVVTDVEEQVPTPNADPKTIINVAIAEYNKMRKQLLNQGYPEVLADKLAHDYIVGGK